MADKDRLYTEAFTYSSTSQAQPVNGFVCDDASCLYVIMRIIVPTDVGGTIIMKMDSSFDVVWSNSYKHQTGYEQVAVTNDESSIVFSLQSSTS